MPDAWDIKNLALSTSVAGSALTIAIKTQAGTDATAADPVYIGFRSSTTSNGIFNIRQITTALSVVVSSGSTLGHTNGIQSPIYVYAIENGTAVELAVSTTLYDTATVVSTAAEGGAGAADAITGIYSTTPRSNVPFRLIGKLQSTQTTAGTWAVVPTLAAVTGFRDANTETVQGRLLNTSPARTYIGERQTWTVPSTAGSTSFPTGTTTATTFDLPSAGYWDITVTLNRQAIFSTLTGGLGALVYTYLQVSGVNIAVDLHTIGTGLNTTGQVNTSNRQFTMFVPSYYVAQATTVSLVFEILKFSGAETGTITANRVDASLVSSGITVVRAH